MTTKIISTGVVTAAVFVVGMAFAQQAAPPKVNCHKNPRVKVEGQVTKVDAATNTITVKENDGSMHEFKASKETLQDLKPGDKIEARLRPAENC